MRNLRCTCGQPVYGTHRCRATYQVEQPTRRNAEEFDAIRRQAAAAARAQSIADLNPPEQLTLDLDGTQAAAAAEAAHRQRLITNARAAIRRTTR